MRDIRELTDETTSYELFTHVYWQIVTRRITGFSALVEYLDCVEEGARKDYVLQSAFPLIREIHWGFFRDLNPKAYPVLWGQITRPHTKYPFAGELKLSMTITDIYCAFIDIHGYTEFSRSRNDASRLRLLDVCIEEDVKAMCRENNVVGNRARGDEIILVGTSAYDVVNAVAMVADYFGAKRFTGQTERVKKRRGEVFKLPDLTVSAGIAGGRKYTSLVITEAGDLSGTVVNTAARLQSRANRVSGAVTRILAAQNVRHKYEAEAAKKYAPMFTADQMGFLDVGHFAFKGVEMRVTEVLIDEREMHRLRYRDHLERFLDALGNHRWTDAVFSRLCEVLAEAGKAMPDFALPETEAAASEFGQTGNAAAIGLLVRAQERFEAARNFVEAVDALRMAVRILAAAPGVDPFLLMYGEAVESEYRRICTIFDRHIGESAEKNRTSLFHPEEEILYADSCRAAKVREAMRTDLIGRVDPEKRRRLWNKLVKQMGPTLDDALYLGK